MKGLFRGVLTGLLVLAGAAAAFAAAPPINVKKVVKPASEYADITGRVTGLPADGQRIRLGLLRREESGLIPVMTVTAKPNGDFLFPTVKPAAYVITPDLGSLPAGFGLYRRHIFVETGREPVRVEFAAGRIQKLVANGGKPLRVLAGDPVTVEAIAQDDQGETLFALSQVDVPAGAAVTAHTENGATIRTETAARTTTVLVRSGPVTTTVTVEVDRY